MTQLVPGATKKSLTRWQRTLRLTRSVLDPRAYAHAFKMLNYYNYTHVAPLREMTVGSDPSISPDAVFAAGERIILGDRVRVGSRCMLWAGPSHGRIVMGDDVLLGPEVLCTAANYRYDDGQPVTAQAMDEADVVIGDDVWIGTRAIILPGVTIGSGSIVGAGSLVRQDVAPMSVAVGVPARIVGARRLASAERTHA